MKIYCVMASTGCSVQAAFRDKASANRYLRQQG